MRHLKLLCICMVSGLLLFGCSSKPKKLAVTTYAVQFLVERIAGDLIEVENISENTLIQRSQLVSNYEEILDESNALFIIGDLQPYMEVYEDNIYAKDVHIIDLATKSAIYPFGRYIKENIDGVSTGVELPYYEGDLFKDIDTYDNDLMLWMDPVQMSSMASDVYEYLCSEYEQDKPQFDKNYKNLEVELARLDADYQKNAVEFSNIDIITMTPSFGVWQKSYGINVYPVCLSKFGALPSENQLSDIKKRIAKDQVRYMAIEPNLPEDMVELQNSLINDLGLMPVYLHNISSVEKDKDETAKDYFSIMYDNLSALENINS